MLIVVSDPARRSTNAFAESHTNVTATFAVATLLHTRAPIGKFAGPVAGLLLSRPTTFHAIGATVNVVAACAATGSRVASDNNARRWNGRTQTAEHLASDILVSIAEFAAARLL